MNELSRVCVTALAAIAFAMPALAQTQTQDQTTPPTQMQDRTPAPTVSQPADGAGPLILEQTPDQAMVDDLVGMSVLNTSGESVGEIDDLLFEDGQIAAAVVAVGGFLGIGSKSVGVDWSAITIDEVDGRKVAVVDLTREELDAAPAFAPYRPPPPAGASRPDPTTVPQPRTSPSN